MSAKVSVAGARAFVADHTGEVRCRGKCKGWSPYAYAEEKPTRYRKWGWHSQLPSGAVHEVSVLSCSREGANAMPLPSPTASSSASLARWGMVWLEAPWMAIRA